MKIVLFAHTPPPHHGQSYMVELLLQGLGGDRAAAPYARDEPGGIALFHVNARLSDDGADVGRVRWAKVPRLVRHAARAILYRFRHGAAHFLYVPAPGHRAAVYRDWLVMALCRPFFSTRTYYWHAAGLSEWLSSRARGWERLLTRMLLGAPDLSIVLSESGRADAVALRSRRVHVVPNGIPDPFPNAASAEESIAARESRVLSRVSRLERAAGDHDGEQKADAVMYRILFLGLCAREKGLFDVLDAIAILHARLAETGRSGAIALELVVAGEFASDHERKEFDQRISQSDLAHAAGERDSSLVHYRGFVGGAEKQQVLRESDVLCFPTYYAAESFGLVLIEAMAHGLPIVATRWRAIPELLPPDYPWLLPPRSPLAIATALEELLTAQPGRSLRSRFLAEYERDRWLPRIREAISVSG